jgi:hypothetical protein
LNNSKSILATRHLQKALITVYQCLLRIAWQQILEEFKRIYKSVGDGAIHIYELKKDFSVDAKGSFVESKLINCILF